MASSSAVKSGKVSVLDEGYARKTVSGDFDVVDFPDYDKDVQQVFRSLGEEYDQLCEAITAGDPELDPAHEELTQPV